MSLEILNRFSANLKQILTKSINLALAQKSLEITPFILFIALLQHRGCLASNLLYKFKLSPKDIALPPPVPTPVNFLPQFSAEAKKIIERSSILAQQLKHQYIGTEHLLQALLSINDPQISAFLKRKNISLTELNKKLDLLLKNTSQLPQVTGFFKDENDLDQDESPTSALDFFGINLTDPEAQLDIDPVIGRQEEIERLIHIISRRTKNNPVLIGEPGVGKTAIAEGLAKRILEKKVPEILLDKKIYKLDLSLIVAGTMYRGEFESRFKQIIEELQNDPDLIIFIDEIHTLMGTGGSGPSGSGTMDAANILKPALAKGQIRCIGATTASEYRKHIESDPALERRFQPILVEEPSPEEALEILNGVKENYEQYHQVSITPEALKAAVDLSVRYIQDKFLPDKAIDLIDEAAAKSRVDRPLSPTINLIKQLEDKISDLRQKKLSLIKAEKLSAALAIKEKEKALDKQIKELKKQPKLKKYSTKIEEIDLANIISKITGLPLGELVNSEKNKVLNLEKKLNNSILGQTEATSEISNLIKRSRAGLSSPNRPLGSFIFLGPSGVGKTELAKVLARALFGDEKSLLRLDMSEFKEGFQASKLIGAPAGYVGYKEGAKLTDFVKQRPHSVILFDEIEKAHPDIFNLFLQILEDGHLTDATGKKVNFKNTLIIMTSNIGLQNFLQQAQIGFDQEEKSKEINYDKIKEHVLGELKKQFRPEFLNRIDKTIVFKPLTISLVSEIAVLQTQELINRLKEQNITLNFSELIYQWLAEQSFSPEEGARALRKIIQEQLETPLAEKILTEEIKPGSTVNIDIEKNKLTIS